MEIKAWTVTHDGVVVPATWEPADDLTVQELLNTACGVLRLSTHPLHQELANRLYERWEGVQDSSKPYIRAHIASILSIHRGLMYDVGSYQNHIDYALLALAQGNFECRDYKRLLEEKWRPKKEAEE